MNDYEFRKMQNIARGNCIKCGAPIKDATQPCPHCLELRTKRRTRYIENGLCVTCGKENDDTHFLQCSQCRDKRRAVREEKVATGLCRRCFKPFEPKGKKSKSCPDCQQYAREYYYTKRRKKCQL